MPVHTSSKCKKFSEGRGRLAGWHGLRGLDFG